MPVAITQTTLGSSCFLYAAVKIWRYVKKNNRFPQTNSSLLKAENNQIQHETFKNILNNHNQTQTEPQLIEEEFDNTLEQDLVETTQQAETIPTDRDETPQPIVLADIAVFESIEENLRQIIDWCSRQENIDPFLVDMLEQCQRYNHNNRITQDKDDFELEKIRYNLVAEALGSLTDLPVDIQTAIGRLQQVYSNYFQQVEQNKHLLQAPAVTTEKPRDLCQLTEQIKSYTQTYARLHQRLNVVA